MKITDLQIDIVERSMPVTPLADQRSHIGGDVESALLRVITDEGVQGTCAIGDGTNNVDRGQIDRILNVLKPVIVGRDSSDREWLWNQLPSLPGYSPALYPAYSIVDVCLWDIAGQEAGMPIYQMLGAARESVDVYATYPPRHDNAESYANEASYLMAEGHKAYKIHPGTMSTAGVIEMVTKVREVVGDTFTLMLDPNNGYNLTQSLAIGAALDELGFYWFEDPVPWERFQDIQKLTNTLKTPLCMSDQPGFLLTQAGEFVKTGRVALPRGTTRKLGITGLKKLASLCEGFGVNCEIGTTKNSSLDAANLNVMLSIENCAYFEWWLPKHSAQWGYAEDMQPDDMAQLLAPRLPGLGFEWDWNWIKNHTTATVT
ncbi:MAG: hypothetical protein HQ478_00970 [Chloroflexi bacterium]|nr:hypothetical protein [Chloroflexota bacterium]